MKVKVTLKKDEFEELVYDIIDQNRESLDIKEDDEKEINFICKKLSDKSQIFYDDIIEDLQFRIEDMIDDKSSELRASITDRILEKANIIIYGENE